MRFIRDHAQAPISVKDLLQAVAISRRALERRFEASVGRTPKQEIMRVRINRAQQMLAQTDLAAATIAMQCGFTRPDKLSTAFRRETGVTPVEYRRQHSVGRY